MGETIDVHNPGGALQVMLTADGARLSGPVQRVAAIEVDLHELLMAPR